MLYRFVVDYEHNGKRIRRRPVYATGDTPKEARMKIVIGYTKYGYKILDIIPCV